MNDKLLANVRFYFAQSVFMNNCHYKAYDRLKKKKRTINTFVVSVSAATLILLILQIIGLERKDQDFLNLLAHIGLLVVGTSLIFEMFNKDDVAMVLVQHKIFAEKYKSLRDEYMSLIEEIMNNSKPENELRLMKDALQKKYSSIGEHAPETTGKDYESAQKNLGASGNSDEEFTWSDEEINKFLPKQLRLINS